MRRRLATAGKLLTPGQRLAKPIGTLAARVL